MTDTETRTGSVALHSGETAVLFQGRRADPIEALLFVRPDSIRAAPKVAARAAER